MKRCSRRRLRRISLQQLALPPEKEAALKALLLTHEERRLDVTAVAGEQQLELNDPAIQKLRHADGASFAQEVLELLGRDDGKIFQQYRCDLAVMAQINGIAVATYTTRTPLTYAESRELQSILAAHSERMPNGFVRPNSINWDAALAESSGRGAFSAATVEAVRHQVADEHVHRQSASVKLRSERRSWVRPQATCGCRISPRCSRSPGPALPRFQNRTEAGAGNRGG